MAQRISPCYVISLSISYAKIRAPNSGFTTNDSRLAGMTRILLTSSLDTLFSAIALEEARAEAAEVLKISPNFSLEKWRQIAPSKDQAVLERMFAALRKAG